jgi:hypothetical protein
MQTVPVHVANGYASYYLALLTSDGPLGQSKADYFVMGGLVDHRNLLFLDKAGWIIGPETFLSKTVSRHRRCASWVAIGSAGMSLAVERGQA